MILNEQHKKILKISVLVVLISVTFSVILSDYLRMDQYQNILQHIILAGGIIYYMLSENQDTRPVLLNSLAIAIIVVISINVFNRIISPESEISTIKSLLLFIITNNYLIITGVTFSFSIFIVKKVILWKKNHNNE